MAHHYLKVDCDSESMSDVVFATCALQVALEHELVMGADGSHYLHVFCSDSMAAALLCIDLAVKRLHRQGVNCTITAELVLLHSPPMSIDARTSAALARSAIATAQAH